MTPQKTTIKYIPILAITQYSQEEYYDNTLVPVCLSKVDTMLPSLFFIGTISIFFIVPLAILIILYLLIALTLMDQPNLIAPYKNSIPQSVIKNRKQVVLMLGTVVLAFFVCLLPFKALMLWIIVSPPDTIMQIGIEGYYNLLYFSRIMYHLNSAINPILYNIMSSKFRNGFLKIFGIHTFNVGMKRRTDINRKNTFNTTSSTNNSSNNTSESFLNRYNSRNVGRFSSCRSNAQPSKNNNEERSLNDSYVTISLHTPLKAVNKEKKIICQESFV